MNQHIPFKRIALAGLGAVFMSAAAGALADPPSRVARLAFVSGPVSFAPAGDNVGENAALNRPLIPGDRLWVEPGARDEVQLNGAALRMAGGTLVTLLNNDDRVTQLQLSQGRLNVHVRRMRPNDVFEVDTPNLALSIREPGDYRIEVDPAGNATMVAVRRGRAEAYGDGNAYRLAGGQAYSFGGTDLRDARYARPLADEFDRWSDSRDRRVEQSRSVRYVSPDLVGYEDLDDQGTWRDVPNYGNVWMPAHVSRDWAPYRDGHWSYVQPWGWTWIDAAPWGYAVSHYGRWARFNDGWGWVPGPRAASPVYAPALVAFVNVGSGSYAPRERPVAWFPLAPREVYRPSYRASPNYITNINITNTAVDRRHIARDDRRDDYANRRVGGAVTAVPANAFAQAQPVSRAAMAVPMAALAAAAIAHNAPVAPERERGHRGQGNQPPQAVMQRQVLARNASPRAVEQAPMPHQQAAVLPAPRMLPQDRRGARQFGQLPPQGSAPMIQQQPMPAQASERDARRDHGQREAERAQEQQMRAQQQDQQARMQQQAREQDQRGRAQQQEQEQRGRAQQQHEQQQAREQEQRGRAQQQEQQARMQQQARDQEQRGRAQQQHEQQQAREQEQRGRAQQQEQQARMQQQARDQEQRGRAQQQEQQQAREQEQRGRAQQQEQQARMQQQARDQEQRGRAQQQQHEQQQAREQEQRGRAQQQEQQARMQQEQAARMQQQAHAQEQARAQQQAHAQEQARAQEQGRVQAVAAQAAAQAQAAQARAAAQAQAAQARAQAQQAAAPAAPAAAASAPPAPEHGRGHGRDRKNEKDQKEQPN